jgi:1-acyl-sn-glycerol-3-phosphate acyltransferase
MWYMLNHTLQYQGDMVRRRFKGEYETDEWGMDWEVLELVRPMLDFLYKVYWRVETQGIENIPDYERALLVSNYSGEMPWDSMMIMTAVLNEHPAQRLVRSLYPEWMPKLPYLSSALVKMGQSLASVENGKKLLDQDELVCVYPEAGRDFSKTYKDRYELKRFRTSDFVKMAVLTGSPLIPVSVVGAEDSYVPLAQIPIPEEFESFPHFPVTVRFPWLGLFGAVPIPSKWYIDFGKPILMDGYSESDAEDPVFISRFADKTRDVIQSMVSERTVNRRSVFR